jgi:hypothetical protein
VTRNVILWYSAALIIVAVSLEEDYNDVQVGISSDAVDCGDSSACRELQTRFGALRRERDTLQHKYDALQHERDTLPDESGKGGLGEGATAAETEVVAFDAQQQGATNLALNKPTTMSSGWFKERAVDGNQVILVSSNNGPVGHVCSYSSTKVEDNPWWQVDLGNVYPVRNVRVTNFWNSGSRLDLFTILVGTAVCGENLVIPQGETGDFVCDPVLSGSTVKIELPGEGRALVLCEVEVYAQSSGQSSAVWVPTAGGYCSDNWSALSGAAITVSSTSECQAACEASSTCKAIVVSNGVHAGWNNKCVLCTSELTSPGCSWCSGYSPPSEDPTGSGVSTAASTAIWQHIPGGFCRGDWTRDSGAAKTVSSTSECQLACEQSSSCKSIVVSNGVHAGWNNKCVLCTEDQLMSQPPGKMGSTTGCSWCTGYTQSHSLINDGQCKVNGQDGHTGVNFGALDAAGCLAAISQESSCNQKMFIVKAGEGCYCFSDLDADKSSCSEFSSTGYRTYAVPTQFGNTTGHCYNGIAYKTEACSACAGPGPSQCTACAPGAALTPWRNHDTTPEGTCQLYTSDVQVQFMPGLGTLASMLLPSYLHKWGIQTGDAVLPAFEGSGTDTVQLRVSCYVRKVVWCKARDNTAQIHNCSVAKESSLHGVSELFWPENFPLTDVCTKVHDGVTQVGRTGSCPGTFPVERVGQFLHSDVSASQDACEGIVKLL